MPRMTRPGYQRLVPDHSVPGYLERGWTPGEGPGMPAESDRKAAWETYARSQGVDPSGMTKAEIIEACGG